MKNFTRFVGVLLLASLSSTLSLATTSAVIPPTPLTVVQDFQNHFQSPSGPQIHFDSPAQGELWWIAPDGKNIAITAASKTNGFMSPVGLSFDPSGTRKVSPELMTFVNNVDVLMLRNGFAFDTRNSSVSFQDDQFEDFVHAYTQGNMVCALTVNPDNYDPSYPQGRTDISFACSDQLQKYYDEQVPFLQALQHIGTDFVAWEEKRSGNFVLVGAHARRTGFYAILEQVNGTYQEIFSGQDAPPCDLMEQHHVPQAIYGECYNATSVQ